MKRTRLIECYFKLMLITIRGQLKKWTSLTELNFKFVCHKRKRSVSRNEHGGHAGAVRIKKWTFLKKDAYVDLEDDL